MIVNEPVNEKGLTRKKYTESRSKRTIMTAIPAFASMLAFGFATIPIMNRFAPEQPVGYKTHDNARQTLTELSDLREEISSPSAFNPINLPYRTEALDGFLVRGGFAPSVPYEQREILDNAISIVKDDINRMEIANPTLATYEGRLESHEYKTSLVQNSGVIGSFILGMVSLVYSNRRTVRERKFGSTNFNQKPRDSK